MTRGYPFISGWFRIENPNPILWMKITRGTPISGNHHVSCYDLWLFSGDPVVQHAATTGTSRCLVINKNGWPFGEHPTFTDVADVATLNTFWKIWLEVDLVGMFGYPLVMTDIALENHPSFQKFTISMVLCNSYVSHYQAGYQDSGHHSFHLLL